MEGQERQQPFELSIENLIQEVEALDWSDLQSASQSAIPENPVITTSPSNQYLRYYKLFRAVLNNEQVTDRSFTLTKLILRIRSTNYYALMVRSKYFFQTCEDVAQIEQELLFVNCLLNSNGKEYQLWTYKKEIFKRFSNLLSQNMMIYHSETQFLDYLLDSDGKNYHVWDYRLWLTQFFGKEEEQIQSTNTILFKRSMSVEELRHQFEGTQINIQEIDWRNCYSLWSYRYNLRAAVTSKKSQSQLLQFEKVEFQTIKKWLEYQSNQTNECGWNYMIGLVLEAKTSSKQIINQFLELSQRIFQTTKNRHAGNAIIQLSDELSLKYEVKNEKIKEVITELIACDKVRKQYYEYLLEGN